jgi:mediator of replication checkpoint protein 1
MRKLMAAFDDDSEEDQPTKASAAARTTSAHASKQHNTDDQQSEEEEDDDDDEPVLKPRGRLAARMAGAALPIQEESESSEDDDHVYQRVRKDLLASKKKSSPVRITNSVETIQSHQSSPRRMRLSTPVPVRSDSPGLFMSPAAASNHPSHHSSDSDSELPADPTASSRLRDLVNRRRAERQAKEQADKEAQEERAATGQAPLSDMFHDEDTRDEVTERTLTQHARPTRKASKKALQDMNRETQRIKRNMQLTHQAKVKKRFSAQDFLSAFNRPKPSSGLANVTNAADVTSSSPPPPPELASEVGAEDTPPSSPPSADHVTKQGPLELSDDEMPTLDEIMTQPKQKGKAPVTKSTNHARRTSTHASPIPLRVVRVNIPPPNVLNRHNQDDDDDDDDLEIVHDRFAMFDEVPKTHTPEGRAMLLLRHLAQLTNHGDKIRSKKGQKPSMTPQQLEIQLRQRAREIANQERAQRLAELRAKGIVVLTEEEREREQMQIEDMLGKAREEADKLRKQEKATAKANGEDVLVSSDESEDEDYVGSDQEEEALLEEEEDDEEEQLELSGSEEEEETKDHQMIDDEAGQDDQEASDDGEAPPDDELALPKSRRARRKLFIEDDEDEDEDGDSATQQDVQGSAGGINDELAAAFGFGRAPTAPMGMSQMFAGTMADSQESHMISQEKDSLEMLRHIPSAPMPSMPLLFEDSQDAVMDSQVDASQTKAPTQLLEMQLPRPTTDSAPFNNMTQPSQIPDPSQDVGFDPNLTPLAARALAPSSTVETVMLGVPESPVMQRRSRLVRRSEAGHRVEEEIVPSSAPADVETSSDAFTVMRQAAKRPASPDFDRKKSNAKGMVDEQAEESEDEFAGIGGASDDEDAGSGDEDDKQMIDETDVNVDESRLAALYAEKSRVQDEAQTSKLYKDLMSGALRRKRGNNAFELDSDEDDQLLERRRRKQREEARKRKLLLQDETLGKLGSNDKKEAFLRAIEDRDEADDGDFLDGLDVDDDVEMKNLQQQPSVSQQQATIEEGPSASQTSNNGNLKRTVDDIELSQSSQQPRKKSAVASLRRSNLMDTFRKPKSLAEVRESVSFLIDEPHNDELASDILLSDDEVEEDRREEMTRATTGERAPAFERRVPAKTDIIDRLTLKKQASSTIPDDDSSSNLAFATSSQQRNGGSFSFKPASLLRKATVNNTSSFSFENRVPPSLNREGSSSVRNGGSKKSSINYQAREAERQEVVQRASRKREENVRKIAGMRRKAGGALGALGSVGGGFE